MMIKTLEICCLIFSFLLWGCSKKLNVAGCYHSNHFEAGMFAHHIELKSDSSFTFIFAGDMMYQHGKGIYHLAKDTVILIFDKNIKKDMPSAVSSESIITQDSKLLLKNNKLYFINLENDKVITGKESVHINHKSYLLFGGHYVKKNFYMKKQQCNK